jgi:uncharacterized protein
MQPVDGATSWTFRWIDKMAAIDRRQWDALAGSLATPLLEWQWLHELESSGSIAPATGWHPCHLTVWNGRRLIGGAALYVKTHSEGEFVFDHAWAQLSAELGIPYYPKLVGMSPATPAVGYRFLLDPQEDQEKLIGAMVIAIDHLCRKAGLSGCHLLFVDREWHAIFNAGRFDQWRHQSYLWRNGGHGGFEDYLRRFKSSQRRNIRREQAQMARQGIEIRALAGESIPRQWGHLMYRYYRNTNDRYGPWAARFLNADFFERIFQHCRRHLLVMAAFGSGSGDVPIALSMLLVKKGHLIGRYWGTERFIKDLHFNMCFYAPIRWAIFNHIDTFDPGAGSPHKIYRGFEAVANTSLHRFYDPTLRDVFQRFIGEVNQIEQSTIDALNVQLPFAQNPTVTTNE